MYLSVFNNVTGGGKRQEWFKETHTGTEQWVESEWEDENESNA